MNQNEGFSIISAFLSFAELGAEWVMYLMVALGFIMIVLFVERLRLYLSTRVDAPSIGRALIDALAKGDLKAARAPLSGGNAMEERVLADAIDAYAGGPNMVEQVIASSLAREKQRYDRFLNYFGTLGNNAPFVGLFGTVIGIIVSFQRLGENPKGGLEVVGPGIAEALVATAVGLLVAIPSVVAYNYFKGMQKQRLGNVEFLARIVLARLNDATPATADKPAGPAARSAAAASAPAAEPASKVGLSKPTGGA
jgi:biopolymer transport protein ExbB